MVFTESKGENEPTVFRKFKLKLMYSFSGLLAGGAAVCLLMEALSLLLRGRALAPADILRIYALIAAGATLFLGVCAVSLLRHEGFRPRNLMGAALGLAWTAGNLVCLLVLDAFPARFLPLLLALIGCYFDFLLSGILLAAFLAAKHRPAYDKDFVVIPGCSISKQGGLLPLLKGRTNRAIRFAWDQERAVGKPARYIPTGGQGPDEIMSEGSAMEFYLLSHGAEQYEVLPEKASTDTYENMLFSKRIIDEAKSGEKTCFVTTNYHVLRSGMLALKAGLDAEGLASGTKWYFWPNGLARECVAILSLYPWQQAAAAALCAALAMMMV